MKHNDSKSEMNKNTIEFHNWNNYIKLQDVAIVRHSRGKV